MANNHPVILAHGILGFGPKELGRLNYWGSALKVSTSLPRYEASVGPLSSAHDRACEMAAQIKGTKVDYGKQHSKEHGHRQHGYDFANDPFVPNWSESNPVHLVGHSLGSPTVRCLQHLLEMVLVQTGKRIGDNGIWRIAKLNGILYLPDVGSKTTSFSSAFAGIFASN